MNKKVKWVGILSTAERNNIGLIRVRQNNVNSEVLGFEIIDGNGEPYDLKNRKVLFCTYFDRFAPVEQYAEVIENGKIVYTMNEHDMQKPVRINFAYFKIMDEEDNLVDTTQNFSYDIMPSIESKCGDFGAYIIRLEEVLDAFNVVKDEAMKEIQQIIKDFNEQVIKQQQDFEFWFESIKDILESVDPGGILLSEIVEARNSPFLNIKFKNLKERFEWIENEFSRNGVSPSYFGAVGDGVTDDSKALDFMVEYAGKNNYPIKFDAKSYIWNPSKTLEFSNSIDFGKSKIIRESKINEGKPLISLRHSKKRVPFDISQLVTLINRKTTRIPELAGNGDCLIHVYDGSTTIFKREGVSGDVNGVSKFDQFLIDNNGYVLNPVIYDFDNVTSIVIQPIDNDFVTIKGGNFYTKEEGKIKDYVNDAILINRSNVILENINSTNDNKIAAASNGVVNIVEAANVSLRNTKLSPKLFEDKGTYDFSAYKVINLFLVDVKGQNHTNDVWGVMGTNFIKNFIVERCSLNRIDSHQGVTNLTIRDTQVGRGGISVVGYGNLVLENVITTAQTVINLRKDYGAFWSGNISAKNITQIRVKDEALSFIFAEYYMDHDYSPGVNNMGLGTGVVDIENYVLDDNTITTTGTNNVTPIIRLRSLVKNSENILHNYRLPKTIKINSAKIVRNIDAKAGFAFMTDVNTWAVRAQTNAKVYPSENFETNINVELDDIDFSDFAGIDWRSSLFILGASNLLGTNADDNYADVLSRPFWNFDISNCNVIHASTLGRFAKLQIRNTVIQAALCYQRGSRSFINSSDCTIRPRANSEDSVLFKARYDRWFFSNCYFDQAFVKDTATVIANPFKSVIQDLFIFATGKGQPIVPTSSMSSCYLTAQYDLAKLKPDIKNFNFKFGNWAPYAVFHPLVGDNNDVPKTNLYIGLAFYNTTYNRLQIYDGSGWRDTSGNPV